jgi:hypothetical protein
MLNAPSMLCAFPVLSKAYFEELYLLDITPCSTVKVNWWCEGSCRFHLQERKISQARNQYEAASKLITNAVRTSSPTKRILLLHIVNYADLSFGTSLWSKGPNRGSLFKHVRSEIFNGPCFLWVEHHTYCDHSVNFNWWNIYVKHTIKSQNRPSSSPCVSKSMCPLCWQCWSIKTIRQQIIPQRVSIGSVLRIWIHGQKHKITHLKQAEFSSTVFFFFFFYKSIEVGIALSLCLSFSGRIPNYKIISFKSHFGYWKHNVETF